MISLEVRSAHSGHSMAIDIERSVRGEVLIANIYSCYQVNPNDQILITKGGYTIEPNKILDKVFRNELEDKTLNSSEFSEGKNIKNSKMHCVYLFNVKQLSKANEARDERQKKQNLTEQLNIKVFQDNNMAAILSYQPLLEIFSSQQLQKYQKYTLKINSLRESFRNLAGEYNTLKEFNIKIQIIAERCEHQRKSINILVRSIKNTIEILNTKLSDLGKIKQKLKNILSTNNEKSLRENSKCFESKKRSENLIQKYQEQTATLKQKTKSYNSFIKDEIKRMKAKFDFGSNLCHEFGNKKYIKIIEQRLARNKREYDEILDGFTQIFHNNNQHKYSVLLENKIQKAEQNAKNKLGPEYVSLLEQLTKLYIQLNDINEENSSKVKDNLRSYMQFISDLSDFFEQTVKLEKSIRSDYLEQNKRIPAGNQVQNISFQEDFMTSRQAKQEKRQNQEDEKQITRRINFKKRLNFIESFATKMCQEQQSLRKKFVANLKNSKTTQIEYLRNAKVPQLDYDDNSSSDLQLIKHLKSSSDRQVRDITAQQFMISNYNWILERLKTFHLNDSNKKMQNMQQILKRTCEIFTKIYNNKINEIINEKDHLISQYPNIQQKVHILQEQLQKNKNQSAQLRIKLKEKQQLLISRQMQRGELINSERIRYDKIQAAKKSLEKQINKQIKINQQLLDEFMNQSQQLKHVTQLNHQLKELLAQKEIQIIEMEKRMNQLHQFKDSSNLSQQKDFKSVVLNDFGKELNLSAQRDFEIQKLRQQISSLQRQNDQLQQDYDDLSSQMRKIITKQTEDMEIQVNMLQKSLKVASDDSISIGQEIAVGQNAIFMPFSSNIYVGVNHKDSDRTLCNMSNSSSLHYVLDTISFSTKTRQLLGQCSFLVVLHVTHLVKQENNIKVKGEIKHLLGFQDDNLTVKNYMPFIPN